MKISTRAADKLSQQIIRYNHKILDFINQSTTMEKN